MNKQFLSIAVLSAAVLAATTACSGQATNPTAAGSGSAGAGAGTTTSASASAAAPSQQPSSAAPATTDPASPTAAATTAAAGGGDWTSVPTTWIPTAQLPLDSAIHWTGGGTSTVRGGVALLGETPIDYPCIAADRASKLLFIYSPRQYSQNSFTAPPGQPSTPEGPDTASQTYTLFADDSAARAAFQEIEKDVAACDDQFISATSKLPSTAVATKTVNTGDTLAYTLILRDEKGNPGVSEGNYSGAADYHAYVVLDRNLIDLVWLAGAPTIDPASGDAAELNTIAAALDATR